jgi:glutathione-regulated potassium-efflux system protein KefB
MAGGSLRAGASAMYNNTVPKPTPFTTPKRESKALSQETAEAVGEED